MYNDGLVVYKLYIHDCTLREHLRKDVSDPQIGFRPENDEKLLL